MSLKPHIAALMAAHMVDSIRRGDEIYVQPPLAAQHIAAHALAVRRSVPVSKRGGLSTNAAGDMGVGSGVARARDIIGGKRVKAKQVDRFCKRFGKRNRKAERARIPLGESRVRQAWDLWGGTPMCDAAASAVRRTRK